MRRYVLALLLIVIMLPRWLRRSPGSPLVFAVRIGLPARPRFEAILSMLNGWHPPGCTRPPSAAGVVLE